MESLYPSYELVRKVGDGAFGEVYEGREVESGNVVAVKLTKLGALREHVPKAILRELWTLQLLSCEKNPFIIKYLTHYAYQSHLALVFVFRDLDVQKLCQDLNGLGINGTRAVSRMTLAALAHIHSHSLMHRDIKPSNLLINSDLGIVELADFGQCRPIVNDQPCMQYENHSDFEQNRHDMTHQVSTRWYRAPELLFGARRYSQAIDLWGVGVVLAELIANLPLFPGASDLDQLIRIFRLRGSPTTERWPSAVNLPDFDKIHFPDTPPTPLNIEKGLTKAPTHTVQLLDALLQLEPTKRPTALTAFSFHFFQLAPPASDPFIIKILIDRRRTQQQK